MNALVTLTNKLAASLNIGDGSELIDTLRATAFKGQVSDAQMTALLVVANQYGLNPWTREIYAFPDRNNGIVPVVGVDGWSRIINSNPSFDGMDFEQDNESCTCIIYRKDRAHPVKVTEYLSECRRDVAPWKSHPRRMLRHKAMIQCARLAFGFVGIFDIDEAERIVEAEGYEPKKTPPPPSPPELEPWPDDKLNLREQKIREWAAIGKTGDEIVAFLGTKGAISAEQKARISKWMAEAAAPAMTYAQVADALTKAADSDALAAAADLINTIADEGQRAELSAIFDRRQGELA